MIVNPLTGRKIAKGGKTHMRLLSEGHMRQEGKGLTIQKISSKTPIYWQNPDKKNDEKWTPSRDMMNFPHPYRMVVTGPPGYGKSTWVFQVLLNAKPEFDDIYLLHCDPEGTHEYDDIDIIPLAGIPNVEFWEKGRGRKRLVIIDDYDMSKLSKDEYGAMERLFGYISSHMSVSIIITQQDMFHLPRFVVRLSNIFVLGRVINVDGLYTVGRRIGLRKNRMDQIAEIIWGDGRHDKDYRDKLVLDTTPHTPYPMRLNNYHIIK